MEAIHFGEGKSAGLSFLNNHNNDNNHKLIKKSFADTYGSNNIFGAYANAVQNSSASYGK